MRRRLSLVTQSSVRQTQKYKARYVIAGAVLCALLWMMFAPMGSSIVVTNTQDSGVGSLRDAINAANLSPDAPTIEFDIPTSDPNFDALNGVWTINLNSVLPTITRDSVKILGFSQTANQGDQNPGVVGSGGTVGYDSVALPQYARPEIAINGGGASYAFRIGGTADEILIEGLAIYHSRTAVRLDGGSGTNRLVKHCLLGLLADGSDPGLLLRLIDYGVMQSSGGEARVDSCYVGYIGHGGIVGVANASVVHASYNEIFQTGWSSNSHDGLDLNGINGSARFNLIHDCTTASGLRNGGGGHGIELGSLSAGTGSNIVENNTCYNNISAGIVIRKGASYNVIRKNILYNNETGILGHEEGRQTIANQIRQNLIFNNQGLAIDIAHIDSSAYDHVTPNDGAINAAAFNEGMDYPVIVAASISGQTLNVAGYVGTSTSRISGITTLDFFKAEDDGNNDGEVEQGDGQNVAHGEARFYIDSCYTDAAGNFNCSLTIPAGLSLGDGDRITAVATCSSLSSSELGNAYLLSSTFPVQMQSFVARQLGDMVVLDWATASEENSDFFQIERSLDGSRFNSIGHLPALGQSNQVAHYTFKDRQMSWITRDRIFYRLKQVDLDGTYTYSSTQTLLLNPENHFNIQLLGNPVSETIRLSYLSENKESLAIRILNIQGQIMYEDMLASSGEKKTLRVGTTDWAKGIYTLQVSNGQQALTRKVFVK